jgi:hypothetical protein
MNTIDTFTCVISSSNSVTPSTANNCWIQLGGLPNDLEFYCEVVDFAINRTTVVNANAQDYYYLTVNEGLEIIGGVQHPRRFNRLCNIRANAGCLNNTVGSVFKVRNFNGKLVNFQLGNPDNSLVAGANINAVNPTYWTLTLKMTPIKNVDV